MRRSRYRHTEYLGLPITIRWSEVDRGDAWGPGTRRYGVSYLVGVQGADFGSWREVKEVFTAYDAAAARALAEAKLAIDASRRS